jgi:hypothetical protein
LLVQKVGDGVEVGLGDQVVAVDVQILDGSQADQVRGRKAADAAGVQGVGDQQRIKGFDQSVGIHVQGFDLILKGRSCQRHVAGQQLPWLASLEPQTAGTTATSAPSCRSPAA